MATYLIGDIQGCYGPLQRLLDKIRFDPAADRLWSCGDVVNRGGQSLKVLRVLHELRENTVITLGNHDLYLLSEYMNLPVRRTRNREFKSIFKAHDGATLLGWLQQQPLAFWSEPHRLLMVHAGVVPSWTARKTLDHAAEVERVLRSGDREAVLAVLGRNKARRWKDERSGVQRLKMITAILTRLRFCDARDKALWSASGPPGSQPSAYKPWYSHNHRLTRDVFMAFGHWAALGVRIKKRYVSLDSGCVWGGRLSAFRLEDKKLFQVPGHYH